MTRITPQQLESTSRVIGSIVTSKNSSQAMVTFSYLNILGHLETTDRLHVDLAQAEAFG